MDVELLRLLLLIIIANGAPILARLLLNGSFKRAVDFNQVLPDSRPVFGSSKTWRGIIAALATTAAAAWLLGYHVETGLLVASYAMLGDLFSSFIKRRLSMPPSSMSPLLDQVPESFFPAFMMREIFDLDILAVILLVLIFVIIELSISHILYKWGIRRRPY
ncbi:MAG: CDP-archaeol synthase [Gammaproteobacteria bacterium]|nr:CDP-archaeol synthase [Gammaproteobacteria bacterium]